MKKINPRVVFALLLFVLVSLPSERQTAVSEEIQSVRTAPDFTLTDLSGKTFRLSELKGKVVLLDFWATWCPFCRASIPVLKSLYKDYKDKGFEIVGLALEYDGGKSLRRFIKEKDIAYTVLVGNTELAREYSVYGVPTRLLIDRAGNIVKRFVGFQDKETFEAAISGLL